jgi:hypothetical protein
MSQNEQMVERVFSTQLNSILFSVNHIPKMFWANGAKC